MATINLYEAYKAKLRKLGYTDSATLQDSFAEAVNLVYAELNDQVFQNQTLAYIGSFDDVIDKRLIDFATLDFDGTGIIAAMASRNYFAVEWEYEIIDSTHGFTDTMKKSSVNDTVFTVLNGTFGIVNVGVAATYEMDDAAGHTIRFESNTDGNKLTIDGGDVTMTYTVGDADTSLAIGAIDERKITGNTAVHLKRTRFLSPETVIFDFLLNEGTGTAVTDEVASYTATLTTQVWQTVWVEPSSGLNSQYRSVFNQGIDFHLQDGGQWALEPEAERERKWYGRGIPMARNILQNNTTYTGPLGIS